MQFDVAAETTDACGKAGFAEAFEARFGRPYDEAEAAGVFAAVGEKLTFPSTRAIALFFHMHDLEDAQLYPWCVGAYEVHGRMANALALRQNSGGLQFFTAMEGRRRSGADRRWLVVTTGPGLASRVLAWLGYDVGADTPGRLDEELTAFWLQNAKAFRNNLKLSKLPSARDVQTGEDRLAYLERVFTAEDVQQQWHAAVARRSRRAEGKCDEGHAAIAAHTPRLGSEVVVCFGGAFG
eukprot:CAMPEP_0117459184 /NCGR_PEP_ID=MMETSP0784-20121206/1336_1 /TAXON_ID=39447 /ORGANISM="" /LENGTH=237 /DNA_ID=CAMNT_0005252767 /DNA_START=1 /DNA_END=712 /DNA_ORIENTATION=-